MQQEAISIVIGLAVSVLMGLGTRPVLGVVSVDPVDNSWPNARALREATDFENRSGAAWLGFLERLFFYSVLCFGQQAPLAIAGWLAFKAATKWAAWQHVVGLTGIQGIVGDPIQTLRYRNAFSTRMVSRSLIGTLYNVLCGMVGMVASKAFLSLCELAATRATGPADF